MREPDPSKQSVRPKASPKKVLLASAARPTNLAVLGTSTAGTLGLAVAGLPILGVAVAALGAMAYGAMILFDFKNERFVRAAHGLPEEPDRAPTMHDPLVPAVKASAIEPADLRDLYGRVLTSHEQLRVQLVASPDFVRRGLDVAYAHASALVSEAGRVALRGNGLRRYLDREDAAAIALEVRRLEAAARAATDQQARATYAKAADAKRRHGEVHGAIEGLYDRIRAQLVAIDGGFDEMQARAVKLEASDMDEAAAMGATIVEQVEVMTSDVRELESAVATTLEEYAV